jgi:DNA-binding MarR family transcriptional regulator
LVWPASPWPRTCRQPKADRVIPLESTTITTGERPSDGPPNTASSDKALEPTDRELSGVGKQILTRRRRRADQFPTVLFGEPGWDALLELYTRESSGARCTRAHLKAALGLPASVTARWILCLEDHGLVVSRPHPTDRGTEFIELTDPARERLRHYFAATLKSDEAAGT